MKACVIIPFRDRGIDPVRKANLDRVFEHWLKNGYVPLIVDDGRSGDQQFCRSAAYNKGAATTDADVLIFSEADILIDRKQVTAAVEMASTPGLVVPFSRFMAIDKKDSEWVRSYEIDPSQANAGQRRGYRKSIGAVNVVSRESLEAIGRFDEHFEGHAYDDDAMERAFRVCCGPTRFVDGPAWHLWHVPGAYYDRPELTTADREATTRNCSRLHRYRRARTPEEIRALTGGAIK